MSARAARGMTGQVAPGPDVRLPIAWRSIPFVIAVSNGARAGQTVFHAHVHLVPKPTAAAGLIVQGGLTRVDQTGLAEEIQRRLT